MVRFSEIQQFPYFLELFPGNFRTSCPCFENFEIFGRMVSAHVYTDTEKFRPSLPSQCFNPRHPTRIALNSLQNLFVRWESPLLEDLLLEKQTYPKNRYSKDKQCFQEPIFIPAIADLSLE